MGDTRRRRARAGVHKSRMQRSLKPCLLTWAPRHSCLCTSRSQVCHLCPENILQESNFVLCSKSLPCECVDKHEFPVSTEHPEKEPETLIGVPSGKESLVLWNQDKTFSYGLS